jgi:hypothetical protein
LPHNCALAATDVHAKKPRVLPAIPVFQALPSVVAGVPKVTSASTTVLLLLSLSFVFIQAFCATGRLLVIADPALVPFLLLMGRSSFSNKILPDDAFGIFGIRTIVL